MKGRVRLSLLVSLAALGARGVDGGSVVLVGTGSPGSWSTTLDLTNPYSTPLSVQITTVPEFQTVCPNPCTWDTVNLPASGTVEMPAPDLLGSLGSDELQTLYITTQEGTEPPSVRARVINGAAPQQAIELQPVRYDTLMAAPATVLNFPSALRSADVHSNLALELIAPGGGYAIFSVHVEVLDAGGNVLAGGDFTNCTAGPTCPDLFLVDVLGQLGITTNSSGQIRATLTSGAGSLWGFVSAVYPAGNVSVAVGRNP